MIAGRIGWSLELWSFTVLAGVLIAAPGLATPGSGEIVSSTRSRDLEAIVALEQPLLDNTINVNQGTLDQITPVSQLSDVKTEDWAFQALQSLVERYGCIAGYPDRTYRGGNPLTRYEFAAGLNVCLNRVNELTATATADLVKKEDLATLQKLQEEFAAELATLRGRVDALEARTTTLQEQKFSPTSRLNALISFNVSHAFASGDVKAEGIPIPGSLPAARLALRAPNPVTGALEPIVTTTNRDPDPTFSYSSYFILTSSFTGKDSLTTILAAGNGSPPASVYSSGGFTSTFGAPYADSNPVNPLAPSSVGLFESKYSFPVGNAVNVVVGPRILGFRYFDVNRYTNVVSGASGLNSYQSTLANNGLSGAGAIVSWNISPQLMLQTAYLARNDASLQYFGGDGSANPARGLFDGSNSVLAELAYSPTPQLSLRFLYTRAHIQAPPAAPPFQPNFPFFLTNSLRGVVDDGFGGRLNDIDSDNFVFNFDWTVTPKLALFGRYSYSRSDIDPINPQIDGGSAKVQAFQLGLAFPDLGGRRGALATLSAVVPFNILSGRPFFVSGYGNGGTEVNLEAVCFYPINQNLAVVPTFFATFNANNFSDNPTVFGTVLRTQFLF